MKHLRNRIINPVYNKYLNIPVDDHHQKIRFYERHYKALKQLPEEAYNDLFIEYIHSLFQVRAYHQFLKIVDNALELIIIENIQSVSGLDLYEETLYMKASALYYQVKHQQADYVLRELINIQGADKKTRSLFMRNAVEALRYNDQYTRSLIILLIIFSGVTIGLELLLVRSFYPELTTRVEQIRTTLLLSGILLFIFQELRVRLLSFIRYQEIIKKRKK